MIKPIEIKEIKLEDLPKLRLKAIKLKKPLAIRLESGLYTITTKKQKTQEKIIITKKKESKKQTKQKKQTKKQKEDVKQYMQEREYLEKKKRKIKTKTETKRRTKQKSKKQTAKKSRIPITDTMRKRWLESLAKAEGINLNKKQLVGYVTIDGKRKAVFFDGDDYFIIEGYYITYYNTKKKRIAGIGLKLPKNRRSIEKALITWIKSKKLPKPKQRPKHQIQPRYQILGKGKWGKR